MLYNILIINNDNQHKRYKRKLELREYKEDKECTICGYNEHTEILQFHHRIPANKRFTFSDGNIGNYAWATVLLEIKKCILLCPNCHNWLHYQEKDTFFTEQGSKHLK